MLACGRATSDSWGSLPDSVSPIMIKAPESYAVVANAVDRRRA
jgi:hypothetical protein